MHVTRQHLGISRAHVVGHSSRGCIALQLALDAPDLVQSLVLLEPVVASGPLSDEFRQTAVGPAFARYFAKDSGRRLLPLQQPRVFAEAVARFLARHPIGVQH